VFPRKFDYVAPSSLDEAVDALKGAGFAKVMSGGMSLLPLMKLRLVSPELVVDIGRIPGLDQISEEGDVLTIGALVRHYQTAGSEKVPAALAAAAAYTGDVQVRNRGTTVGAVVHGDLAADQPAAVLALGGVIVVQGPNGVREIPATDFFVDTLTTAIEPDEVATAIKVPRGGSSAYDKLGRRGGHTDYAVAGAAAWVKKDNGNITECRVALTGVAGRPTLAEGTAEAMVGTDGSAEAIAEAASKAADGVSVLEDLYGSEEYKAHLATVYAKRALTLALNE